jgi:hypothetical protein
MLLNRFQVLNYLFFALLIFSSCSKKNDSTPEARFTWTHEGVSYTATMSGAYEQSVALAPYQIIGIIGTNFNTNFTTRVAFSLTSFNTGSYAIAGTGPNRLSFVATNGNGYAGVGGQITITSNSNGFISGNFSVTVNTPSPNTILSGNFSNIPVQP